MENFNQKYDIVNQEQEDVESVVEEENSTEKEFNTSGVNPVNIKNIQASEVSEDQYTDKNTPKELAKLAGSKLNEKFDQYSEKIKISLKNSDYSYQALLGMLKSFFSVRPSSLFYLPKIDVVNMSIVISVYIIFSSLLNSFIVLKSGILTDLLSTVFNSSALVIFFKTILSSSLSILLLMAVIFAVSIICKIKLGVSDIADKLVKILFPMAVLSIFIPFIYLIYPLLAIFILGIAYILTILNYVYVVMIINADSSRQLDSYLIVLISIFLLIILKFILGVLIF